MERFTAKLDGKGVIMLPSGVEHHWCISTRKFGDMTMHYLSGTAADRLAAYEDTGLTPERVAELAQAEQDGRLVVLPCKVGDLLYEVDLPEYGVITCKAVSISYYNGPMFHVPGNEEVSSLTIEVEVIEGHGKGSSYNFEIEDFGKTVFLTRQEAEAAVERKEEAEGNGDYHDRRAH